MSVSKVDSESRSGIDAGIHAGHYNMHVSILHLVPYRAYVTYELDTSSLVAEPDVPW
jgi:hypothetical protein